MTVAVTASDFGKKGLPLSGTEFGHGGANSSEFDSGQTGCLDVAGLGDIREFGEIIVCSAATGFVSDEVQGDRGGETRYRFQGIDVIPYSNEA